MNDTPMRDFIAERQPQAIIFDGLDDALVGYAERPSQRPVAVYDYDLLIECFVAKGETVDEAVEWIDYNIVSLWAGEMTPLILYRPPA
jgi:hypothetical protein